jgi:hypothetical protein
MNIENFNLVPLFCPVDEAMKIYHEAKFKTKEEALEYRRTDFGRKVIGFHCTSVFIKKDENDKK